MKTHAMTVCIMDEPYYTVSGAMKALNVGRSTIDNEVREGRLEVFHHPKGNLFSKSSCLKWIMTRTSKARR